VTARNLFQIVVRMDRNLTLHLLNSTELRAVNYEVMRVPCPKRFVDFFAWIDCKCEVSGWYWNFYDDYFFLIQGKIYQVAAKRCCTKLGLHQGVVVRKVKEMSGRDLRLVPLFSRHRFKQSVSEIAHEGLIKEIYNQARSLAYQYRIDSSPGPPDSKSFYLLAEDWKRVFEGVLNQRSQEIEISERKEHKQWLKLAQKQIWQVRMFLNRRHEV
jgi:hypothetical protein